eukprot:Colp12_sorted_trinity150504_noHs@932
MLRQDEDPTTGPFNSQRSTSSILSTLRISTIRALSPPKGYMGFFPHHHTNNNNNNKIPSTHNNNNTRGISWAIAKQHGTGKPRISTSLPFSIATLPVLLPQQIMAGPMTFT